MSFKIVVTDCIPLAFDLPEDNRVIIVEMIIGKVIHIAAVKRKDGDIDIREITIDEGDDNLKDVFNYLEDTGLINEIYEALFSNSEFIDMYRKMID